MQFSYRIMSFNSSLSIAPFYAATSRKRKAPHIVTGVSMKIHFGTGFFRGVSRSTDLGFVEGLESRMLRCVDSAIIGCFSAMIFATPGLTYEDDAELDISDYVLTFDESFDTLDVSAWGTPTSRWIAHTPWAGDFGDAKFVDPRPDFPFTLASGSLRIQARRNDIGKWESGLLSAVDPNGNGFAQQGGYFEARMKLPIGPGVWPAFWLVGVDRTQYSLEIDVIEYYGHLPDRFFSIYHMWSNGKDIAPKQNIKVTTVPTLSLTSDFHNFGVDISNAMIRIYLDRRLVWKTTLPDEFRNARFFPLVNLALGSGWPIDKTPNPSNLYVEYVRAYDRK
jgi:hypothetical protein